MVPTNLVHIVVGPGRGMWDWTKSVDSLVEVYPRTFRGIGFTLSPYPLSLLRPFPGGCWKTCKTSWKTHIIGRIIHSARVLEMPQLPPAGSFTISLVFYCVSVPLAPKPCRLQRFWSIWAIPLCFTMFRGLGRPCPVNYNVSDIFLALCFVLRCFWALGAHAPWITIYLLIKTSIAQPGPQSGHYELDSNGFRDVPKHYCKT